MAFHHVGPIKTFTDILKVIHPYPNYHPKRTDYRLSGRSIWIDVHHLGSMGDAAVEVVT